MKLFTRQIWNLTNTARKQTICACFRTLSTCDLRICSLRACSVTSQQVRDHPADYDTVYAPRFRVICALGFLRQWLPSASDRGPPCLRASLLFCLFSLLARCETRVQDQVTFFEGNEPCTGDVILANIYAVLVIVFLFTAFYCFFIHLFSMQPLSFKRKTRR